MLFRLFTENKNLKEIENIISKFFKGFTLFKSVGYWDGIKEKSLCLEIATETKNDLTKLKEIAKQINKVNKQNCCLIQQLSNRSFFI